MFHAWDQPQDESIPEPRRMALGKKFLLRPAGSPWKLFHPQHDVDDNRDLCRAEITALTHQRQSLKPPKREDTIPERTTRGCNTLDMIHNIVDTSVLLFFTPCCSASGVGDKLDNTGVPGTTKTFCLVMSIRPLSTPTS